MVHSTSEVTMAAIAKPERREIDKNTTARASAMFCSATPCQAQKQKSIQGAQRKCGVFCKASEAKQTGDGRGEGRWVGEVEGAGKYWRRSMHDKNGMRS